MFAKKSISRIFSILFVIVVMLAVTPLQGAHAAGVRYAKPAASGTDDCSNWANACTLQTALTGSTSGDEIWVAAGTHKPTTNVTARSATFQLNSGVALYGGFAGTETTRDQRNPSTNVTILSGDIDNNDSQTPIITDLTTVTGNTTNSYHVVTALTGVTGATLDGFTITAGKANGDEIQSSYGAGMYNYSSSLTLTNVSFSGNSATTLGGGAGGGMYNFASNPTLTNVTFRSNSANNGGGMLNYNSSSPTLTNVTFSDNSAKYTGGGMYNMGGSPTLTNVTFSHNSTGKGGGMINFSSDPTLTNVTFSSNSAVNGGGMYNQSSDPTLTNVTFSGNSAGLGGGIYNFSVSNPQIRNTIFWENTPTQVVNTALSTAILSYNIVQGGCPAGSTCTNIITTDPMLGLLGNYGGFTQTIPLLPGSSAIDTGNGAYCPTNDQRGETRSTPNCDIGAYESQGFTLVISGGNNQSAARNSGFVNPLSVTVAPLNAGEPVDGGQVTFTAPASGASALISGSPATISSSAASVTATANNTLGAYNVSASTIGTSPISFSLENINNAPIITEGTSTNVSMSEDGSPTPFSLTLHATDVDGGDTITWSISTPASHGTASASGAGTSKSIVYIPALNYNGSDSFIVQVSDGNGGTDTITVNVTINAVEPPLYTIFLPLILR